MLGKDRQRRSQLAKAALEALEGRMYFSQAPTVALPPAPAAQTAAYVWNASPQSQALRTLEHWRMNWTAFTTPEPAQTPVAAAAPVTPVSKPASVTVVPSTTSVAPATPAAAPSHAVVVSTPVVATPVVATQTPAPSTPVTVTPSPVVASTPETVTSSPVVPSSIVASAPTISGPLPTLSYVTPSSNPALPAGMNTFTPPVNSQAVVAGAPIIGASNQTAGPDQSIVVTGSQFTSDTGINANKDTQFIVYGQTGASNATLKNAQIQDIASQGISVTIDSSEPANSMYLLWAENSKGVSAPVAINQTQAWWIGTPGETVEAAQGQTTVSVATGQTMSVYGKNLSNGAATPQSWVYLQPTNGGAGQWATVNAVNPYKVDFTTPTAAGSYQVWVNNGLGGIYGWSEVTQNGAPVVLSVAPAQNPWTGVTINVKDYGATGNGKTNDGPAILRAITALQNLKTSGNTLYLPAGTYLISGGEQLMLPSWYSVRVLGDGVGQTKLLFQGNVNQAIYTYGVPFEIGWADNGATNDEIDSITIANSGLTTSGPLLLARNGHNVTLNHVNLVANNTTPLAFNGMNGVTIENSTIQGMEISLLWASNVFVNNTAFSEGFQTESAAALGGTSNVSFTNCTIQDINNAATDGTGTGQGRFLEYNLDFGPTANQYVAGNTTINLGSATPGNDGEQINIEGNGGQGAYGVPTAVTSSTLTFSGSELMTNPADHNAQPVAVGHSVIIDSGTGDGQMRFVIAVSYTYNADGSKSSVTITLDHPFAMIPDSTSNVFVGTTAYNSVFYGNTLSTEAGVQGGEHNLDGSTGLEVFGGSYGLIFDSNTTNRLRRGVLLTSAGNKRPTLFNEIINNNFENGYVSGVSMGPSLPTAMFIDYMGTIIRGNAINTVPIGFIPSWQNVGADVLVVFEKNTVDAAVGVSVYNAPDVLVRGNTFVATADPVHPLTTPQAIVFNNSASPAVLLRDNVYQNFATGQIYNMVAAVNALPDAALAAPYTTVLATVSAGSTTKISLPVWSDGSTALAWNASSSTSWLKLAQSSGTIATENTVASIPLIADATGLTAGTYVATLTVMYEVDLKQVNKTFTVELKVN